MNLLIKPASGLCNMRCSYCFYADEMAHREKASYGIMSDATVEQVIRKALSASERDGSLGLSFQGGEPTLAGLDFFRFVTDTVEQYNDKRLPVSFAIQTNGYAIDEEWAKFLGEHGFLVGLSIDGPKELHDCYRVDTSGKGTFDRVLRAAELHRQMEDWFLRYVDPKRDGKGEPVCGRGQRCMVGPDSNQRIAFNSKQANKYGRK